MTITMSRMPTRVGTLTVVVARFSSYPTAMGGDAWFDRIELLR